MRMQCAFGHLQWSVRGCRSMPLKPGTFKEEEEELGWQRLLRRNGTWMGGLRRPRRWSPLMGVRQFRS